MNSWSKAVEVLNKARSVAIFPHYDADGDALGSAFALAIELKRLGKDTCVFLDEEIQKKLSFISSEAIETVVFQEGMETRMFDLAVAVDSGDIKRLGKRADLFKSAGATIKIDHHISEDDYADYNFVDTKWAATCAAIWELLTELVGEISDEASLRIYTGIYTDTGGFKHSNTDAKVHIIAAKILSKLGDLSYISRIFQEKSKGMIRLYNIAVSKMEFFFNERVAYVNLTIEDFEKAGAIMEDSEGLATYLREIEGVDTSVFIRPGDKKDELKASLRSNEIVDVSQIAASFNGGGHKRAAGFTYYGDEQSMKKTLLERLGRALNDT
ncbi:MAG: bifunctional oligoribonuclease/PAP phosphatase NrnA [Clostridiaceae bacterium]|jgi:phosphoesterase RecJ-like protein|nr:bifunctional oligoribonuclease/PAP phosphatase NrnA [Clostridiaceae bacterium]